MGASLVVRIVYLIIRTDVRILHKDRDARSGDERA
jgi:hypothetical protein